MAKVEWSPQARTELKEILKFIARRDKRPQTAANIEAEIKKKLILYAGSPDIGHCHELLPNDWRCCRHKRWTIVYRPGESGIQVLRIVDAARNFTRLFADPQ